jgi:hypothetical protein
MEHSILNIQRSNNKRPLKICICPSFPQGYAHDAKPQPWLDAEYLLPGQDWQISEGDYLEL